VLVLLAAALPLLPTLQNGFVYDDQVLLPIGAPGASDPAPVSLKEVATGDLFGRNDAGQPASGYYRPLTRLTYWVEGKLYRSFAPGYHLDNLLLAAAVSLLLYWLLESLPALSPCALPAALLFAAHPVHAESLALITGRTDPLALLFLLLALWASLSGVRWWRVTLLYVAALLCKESAAILFPAVAIIGRLGPAGARPSNRRVIGLLFAGGVATLAFFALKILVLGIVAPADAWTGEGTLAQRLLTFLAVLPAYLGLLIWPAGLSIVHEVALVTRPGDPRVWLGLGLLLLLFYLIQKGTPAVRLGLSWMLWTLLPASNLVPISFAYEHVPFAFFERYLFVPSAGACLAAAGLLVLLVERLRIGRRERILAAAAAALLLALPLGARTFARARDFRSETALIQAAVESAEQKPPLLIHLAEAQLRSLDAWSAVSTYERALELDPENAGAVVGRARALSILAQHVFESAEQHRARNQQQDAERIAGNARNMLDEAQRSLEQVVRDHPDDVFALEVLGTIAGLKGDTLAAARWYHRAWLTGRSSPSLAGNYLHAAELLRYQAKREGDRGMKFARTAARHYALGVEALAGAVPPVSIPEPVREMVLLMLSERADNLFLRGDYPEAREAYQQILELEPKLYRCHEGLGAVAKQLGRRQEAYRQFELALDINPDAFVALNEMLTMCQEDGRTAEATEYLRRLQRMLAENVQRGSRTRSGEAEKP